MNGLAGRFAPGWQTDHTVAPDLLRTGVWQNDPLKERINMGNYTTIDIDFETTGLLLDTETGRLRSEQ